MWRRSLSSCVSAAVARTSSVASVKEADRGALSLVGLGGRRDLGLDDSGGNRETNAVLVGLCNSMGGSAETSAAMWPQQVTIGTHLGNGNTLVLQALDKNRFCRREANPSAHLGRAESIASPLLGRATSGSKPAATVSLYNRGLSLDLSVKPRLLGMSGCRRPAMPLRGHYVRFASTNSGTNNNEVDPDQKLVSKIGLIVSEIVEEQSKEDRKQQLLASRALWVRLYNFLEHLVAALCALGIGFIYLSFKVNKMLQYMDTPEGMEAAKVMLQSIFGAFFEEMKNTYSTYVDGSMVLRMLFPKFKHDVNKTKEEEQPLPKRKERRGEKEQEQEQLQPKAVDEATKEGSPDAASNSTGLLILIGLAILIL